MDVSVAKAFRDLGYRPRFSLRDSIRATVEERSHLSKH